MGGDTASDRKYRQSAKGKARQARWRVHRVQSTKQEADQRQLKQSIRRQVIEAVRAIKAVTPCADCGGIFDPVCMDFDHRPGEIKLGTVSHMATFATARAEMAKCDLVCANCHRIRTWKRREHPHKLAREAAAAHPQLSLGIPAEPQRTAPQCSHCSADAAPGKRSCEKHLKFDRDRDRDAVRRERARQERQEEITHHAASRGEEEG